MKANHSANEKHNPYNHKFDYQRNNNHKGEEDGQQGTSNKRPKSSSGKVNGGMIKFSSGYQSDSPIVNRPVSPSGMPRRLFIGQV